MGIKGDSSGSRGELRLGIHMGQFDAVSVTPHPRWVPLCHTSDFYEEDSTRKGGPLGRAWHLLLGATSRGETHHPWVYPVCGTYIYIHQCMYWIRIQ